jgi:hypothetical protein
MYMLTAVHVGIKNFSNYLLLFSEALNILKPKMADGTLAIKCNH